MDSILSNTLSKTEAIEADFKDFILKQKHPCVMAKTVFLMEKYHLKTYNSIKAEESAVALLEDLERYINQYDFDSNEFESFIAVFPNDTFDTEIEFENALWKFLQRLHQLDDKDWDPSVSDNPEDSNFSFSLKGRAFYIVGLHPNSSRIARQSPQPTIVFNLHWQFEKLRDMGTYKRVKKRIRKRDKKLQGTINPVLKDFGNDTETKQYSGRQVEGDWKCPFHSKS
ncbi:guanitoxin biosynthesis heme-dependent pre-guanitoxin N-hydroxylase GntA [Formosa sp. 3Alg 14/1]|uniref:guanitoxin biosynthesis heme-dependent pre-guanitoxin N-hydroxylase GntA n=1 Tax=Formosa sp. 3Alg 14/1 TaxID=3382190 RepID=UPI0039BE2CF3